MAGRRGVFDDGDAGWGGYGQYKQVPYLEKGRPYQEPYQEGISEEVLTANPLARPPNPVEYMPVEQQIWWNDYQAGVLNKRREAQSQLNNSKAAARKAQLELDQESQGTSILDSLDTLDPTRDDYLDKKTDLFVANPYGATSDRVKAIVAMKDQLYEQRQETLKAGLTRRADMQKNLDTARINQAFKDASEIGDPALIDEVSRLSAETPELAVARVQEIKSQRNQENFRAQFRAAGLTDEEIDKQFYVADPNAPGGRRFLQGHAEAALKESIEKRQHAGTDEKQLMDMYLNLSNKKLKASDPLAPKGSWNDTNEQLLQRYERKLDQFADVPQRVQTPQTAQPRTAQVPGTKATLSDGRVATLGADGKWHVKK